jgi:hypothetical protein
MGAVATSPAQAQCSPDPTVANGITNCTRTDGNGLTVNTSSTRVIVAQGATVSPGSATAAITGAAQGVRISVNGRIDGNGKPGILVTTEPSYVARCPDDPYAGASVPFPFCWPGTFQTVYPSSSASIEVAAGATVTGAQALLLNRNPNNTTGSVSATLINAGTMTGTIGPAIVVDLTSAFGALSVTNQSTGTIAAMGGAIGSLSNAGTVDGGSGTAFGTSVQYATITNTGRIISIGGSAIDADGAFVLTNSGTITGAVTSRARSGQNSTIDTLAGTITGNVTLGAGDDTLLARYDGGRLVTGITGTIDGGAGIDTLRLRIAGDATLGALALPTGFERLGIGTVTGATVTLGTAFGGVGGLVQIEGGGTVVNRGTLTGTAPVVSDGFSVDGSPVFTNAGTIRTTGGAAGSFAVQLNSVRRFQNDGTVDASGNGVSLGGQGSFVNAGTITAAGTGVSVSGNGFDNGGTIRSTAGTAAILSGGWGTNWTNRGTIDGAVTGVLLTSTLVNTGTVTSPATGVVLGSNGFLDNRAGGRVDGGIAPQTFTFGSVSGTGIVNAGTINGNVRLGGSSTATFNSNSYYALPGGVLNGNLTLGNGELLVTELANTGAGAFAGLTGTVTATNALLRYRVRADATATGAAPAGFAATGYDLYDNAALTLTGATQPLSFAGSGSVDLNGTITTSTQPAIQITSLALARTETAPTTTTGTIAITSRGTLTLERGTGSQVFASSVVSLGGSNRFTNVGEIVARDLTTTGFGQIAAISGGTIVNDGTITLDNAVGISGAERVTNNGTIAQAAGGRSARGILSSYSSLTLLNTGTIDVAGDAVTGGYGLTVDNSGRIASTGGFAIGMDSYGTATITNRAGATIAGRATAIRTSGGTLTNAGTITGSVDLGYSPFGQSFAGATYIADGGTIDGDLRFGSASDTFVSYGATGVSGTIDGGEGIDTFVHARTASETVTLADTLPKGFERQGIRALGTATVLTLRAATPIADGLTASGDGAIVNTVDISGSVALGGRFGSSFDGETGMLAAFTNQARVDGGISGEVRRFVNTGTISAPPFVSDPSMPWLYPSSAVSINSSGDLSFANDGTITGNTGTPAVSAYALDGSVTADNTGRISAGMSVGAYNWAMMLPATPAVPLAVAVTNSGTVTAAGGGTALSASILDDRGADGTVNLDNSGTIEATGADADGVYLEISRRSWGGAPAGTRRLSVTNTGTIRANDGGTRQTYTDPFTGERFVDLNIATALTVDAYPGATATIANAATGTIEATGTLSTALNIYGATLDLTNAGTIRGGAGTPEGERYYAGAIDTDIGDDRIVNTGTIIGSIALGDGNDRIENYGRIEGDVFLGAGDDSFLHRASAILTGTVDAGTGDDSLVIDATGGGTVRAAQFINFERFSQIGAGAVQYVGAFRADTLGVSGGTVTVAAGETLSSTGAVTVTGGDGAETVLNDGTIAGSVVLGAGNDRVVNAGTIDGAVLLGDGDDGFVERAGSRVAGGVDGGAGTDRYTVALAGDRSGIGARSGFELLSVEGNGTLTLALDQSFDAVTLAGTGLALTLGGNRIGAVTGSDARETLSVDGDVAQVSLGAGDDVLALGTTSAAGRYAGGVGTDTLRFTAPGATTLAGTATGFEQVALTGPLLVTGTLGSTGAPLAFGPGDQQLTVADGGTLAGTIDLGAGNDSFRLAANAVLDGTVAGGAGDDSATLVLAGARTLAATTLTGFETLATEGAGTLTLTGSHGYNRLLASGNLTIGTGAGLTARELRFSGADNRLTIAGGFTGAVDGGAGNDTITVSGGSAAAPIAFSTIANVEALAMSAGFATIAGNAALGSVDLTGGRLVGLAGSVLRADRIAVAQGATFGSAGTVTGNLTVAGILSPGASPGTMTVNGNVALATGSRTLFELTPTVSDRLVVNGALSIAGGTALEIVASGALRPGTSYDLITASGGITGAFTTVVKPADLFGFIVQRADRIQLLGQFLGDARFAPQVARSIAYANATLAIQPATSTLFAALPALVEPSGASNARGFAQLTPEAYATATQLGVDHALTLGQAARGPAFATTREEAGLFTFAQTLGQWHRLAADPAEGSATARSQSYGFLGGLGFGSSDWSVGAFAGYLNGRQQIDTLGARTRADGAVAGVHGRYTAAQGWGFAASLLYDGGKARTDRALPGTRGASGRYDLHSWVSDLSAHYAVDMTGGWTLQPRLGVTYVRTSRDGVTEGGASPFALRVARDRHVAGFADAGLSFARSDASDAALRPFVSLGARYQIEGRRVDAQAGYAGGGLGLTGVGASRARLVGTAAGGIGYRLSSGLDLFTTASAQTGRDDHQETITTGVRLRF